MVIVPPLLMMVTELGTVTVIPDGMMTVSVDAIVVGGPAPPQVAGSFQFPV